MWLTLVRHGECLAQADQAHWADPDSPLSPRGVEQSKAVAAYVAGASVTRLLSSPLLRALETADLIGRAAGLAAFEVWPELREGFSGSYAGLARETLQARFPRAALDPRIATEGWRHGDASYEALWLRCADAVARLGQFSHEDHVVLVSHGGCLNYLLHILLGIDRRAPRWFELDNGSLTRVRLVPDPPAERPNWPLYPPVPVELIQLNAVAHLETSRA
jgi:broad specificity phosphatase PhoE